MWSEEPRSVPGQTSACGDGSHGGGDTGACVDGSHGGGAMFEVVLVVVVMTLVKLEQLVMVLVKMELLVMPLVVVLMAEPE